MAASVLSPQPTHHPTLLCPTRLLSSAAGPRATLAPALLAKTASQTPPRPPPIRSNALRAPSAAAADQGSKKRKPPLPPSAKDAKKAKTDPSPSRPTPPAACGNVATMTAQRRRALDKKVAGCFLSRNWDAPARSEGKTALRCLCRGLPQGTRCALHQDAPGRSWMAGQGGVPLVGGEGVVMVPKVRNGDGSAVVFAEYARWRRCVRMPSRFYVEHVRTAIAGQKDRRAEVSRREDVLSWAPIPDSV